jgi:chromate transport protein ChrA
VDHGGCRTAVRELAWLFLKLGTIAFGGPATHMAMMEDEVVRRRRWLTREEFLDYLGATNLIPGPNSTELAIHIGHARAGWHGLIVAGACGVFVKAGAILFGSGYVLLADRSDLVDRLHWLTEPQLLDAVAVGQVTPGPVFTTATFIGYVLGGGLGAVAATVGIFLPDFVFVAASGPIVPRMRRSRVAAAVLDGVNVASLALMVVVTIQLGTAALVDPLAVVIAAVSLVLLIRFRVNSAWLVLGGAVAALIAAVAAPGA